MRITNAKLVDLGWTECSSHDTWEFVQVDRGNFAAFPIPEPKEGRYLCVAFGVGPEGQEYFRVMDQEADHCWIETDKFCTNLDEALAYCDRKNNK